MTQVETRNLGYAIAGSLAVHVLLAVSFALWIGLVSFQRLHLDRTAAPEEEPEVTLVLPEPTPVPPTPEKEAPFIRTTQNTEAAQAPAKADFISNKNTVAMAKSAPSPQGDQPLPNMQGLDFATNELANRTFRDGETRNDSAPAPPTAAKAVAPPAPPKMKTPDQPRVAKKEETRAETMMQELDAALAKQEAKPQDDTPDALKTSETREALPHMRSPEEKASPRAIPVASAATNTPRPEKDAFQPETHRGTVKGMISNVGGEDAVNAANTAEGRYRAQVWSIIEKKWHEFARARPDVVEPGKLGLHFYVNKDGKVEDFKWAFTEASPLVQEFTLRAVQEAKLPPIPKDLLPIIQRILMEPDVVIY
jgi:outer membrane biosynthesis protein TonB